MFGQSCQCVKDSNKDGSLGFPCVGWQCVHINSDIGLNKLGHSSLLGGVVFWL